MSEEIKIEDIENGVVLDKPNPLTNSNLNTVAIISNETSLDTNITPKINTLITNSSDNTDNTNNTDNTKNNNKNQKNGDLGIKELRIFGYMITALMIFVYSGFIVCDIYYGLNDKSCVSQDVGRISINLKTFLLVRGFVLLGFVLNILLGSCLVTNSTIQICGCFQITTMVLVVLLLLAWNIVGAVIFWGYMDTSECNNPVYNYTFASLIIMFVGSVFSSSSTKYEKK